MWKMETKQMIETDQMDMMEQQTEKYFPCRVFADKEERFGT